MHELATEDQYVNPEQPALGKRFRRVCSCGWAGEWSPLDDVENESCPNAVTVP